MQGTLQNRLPSLAAVWRLLETTQIRLFSAVAVSALLSFLLVGEAVAQESGSIQGTVTDATNGESLPGANVVIVGTQQGAATDAQGNYTIDGIEPGTYSVRASFLGYQETVREGIQVQAGQTTTVNFTLQQQEQALDELVVVGYGEQQRAEVTGSIAEVSSEDLADINATGPQEVLQGLASGVAVTDNPAPGEGARVRIRGLNTLNNNNPLYVVDGVPVGGLQAVNPSNIESIEVLKDASATAIYGSRGANGVIIIDTKGGRDVVDGEGSRLTYSGNVSGAVVADEPEVLSVDQFRGAVEQFARGIAPEIAPKRINVVSPGQIDTPMVSLQGEERAAFYERMTKNNLIPRAGTPDEVAQAIVFAVQNDFVTGTTIDVDGGWLLS